MNICKLFPRNVGQNGCTVVPNEPEEHRAKGCRAWGMHGRWGASKTNAPQVGYLQDMRNARQVWCRTWGMHDRWGAGHEECTTGGVQDTRNARQVGCRTLGMHMHMTGGVQDMRNVRQDRGSAWRMYNRRGAGHEECTAGWNWMQDMRIYERRLSENWAFMKRGKQDLFTLDTFIEENSWFICRCQRFDFFFVDLDNKQFVSFHKKKKFISFVNVYIVLLITPYTVLNVFVSFRSWIISK